MVNSRDALLSPAAAPVVNGKSVRVFDAFGGAYFSFYFSYFSFSESLPAGQGVV